MSGEVGKFIANTAFSFTLSGNSGISPFLTMFLIGIAGKVQPQYLNLDETMNKIMTSWPSLSLWGIATILELIGKCVPVLDQAMDSVEVFIVPILSTLGSLSAFGSFSSFDGEGDNNGADDSRRGLSESTSSVAAGTIAFFRIMLIFIGTILALSIHFLKMLIRLIGEGCLTQLITVGEVMTVCVSVLASIFVRQFAIFAASCLFIGAFYNAKKRYEKRQAEEKRQELIEQHKMKQNDSIEEGHHTSPSSNYVKMDNKMGEADQFLRMFRLKS